MIFRSIFLIFGIFSSLFANSNFGAIVTNSSDSVYTQIGKDISGVLKNYDIKLKAIETSGSAENLDLLYGLGGKNIFWGIVQKDALSYFTHLMNQYGDGFSSRVKEILPLYNEEIHIFKAKGKEISFKKGDELRVGILSKESATYYTSKYISRAYGVDFKYVYSNLDDAIALINNDKLDIYISVTSKSNKLYKDLKDIDLFELPENQIMSTIYKKNKIIKDDYLWLNQDIFVYTCPTVIVSNLNDKNGDKAIEIFIKLLILNYQNLVDNGHVKWKDVHFDRIEIDKDYHNEAIDTLKKINIVNLK